MKYDEIKRTFQSAGTLRCSEVIRCLESLGFLVRNGTKPNHKIFTHPELSKRTYFVTGSFSCEHGRNGEVKRPYLKNILRILEKYEDALKTLELNGENYD